MDKKQRFCTLCPRLMSINSLLRVYCLLQIQIGRHLRQIGQELFHIRQCNRHSEPTTSGNDQLVDLTQLRLNERHSHVPKQSVQSEDLNAAKLSLNTNNFCGKQHQNHVQQFDGDDEVVFKTTDNRKVPAGYIYIYIYYCRTVNFGCP